MAGERKEAVGAIRKATDAHTRLNTFYTVIAIFEGGCLPGGSETANETAQEIIRLCKQEGSRQLRLFDKAVADASRPLGDGE